MSLRNEQMDFLRDVALLLSWLWAHDFEVTGGELARTPEQQEIYFKTGKSKTLTQSNHLVRCAIDLNLFVQGVLCSFEQLKEVGAYWESLNAKNRWGGNFKGLVDTPHFERNVQ